MANIKTIALSGAETAVYITGQNCDIRNDGTDVVYASAMPGVTAGADGVLSIPAGQAAKLLDANGAVYLLGTGSVQLCGNDYSELVFKSAASASGGGGTVDEVARNAISNPNLLINPDFKINQRGQTEYTGYNYTVDRWRASTGAKITVNSDGTITHTSPADAQTWLIQEFEDAYFVDGYTVTLSAKTVDGNIISATGTVPAGVMSAITNIVSVPTSVGATIDLWKRPEGKLLLQVATPAGTAVTLKWVKLELGSVATPFTPPDPATELTKCQRYYQIHSTGDIAPVDLRPSMRIAPTITQLDDGNYAYNAEL